MIYNPIIGQKMLLPLALFTQLSLKGSALDIWQEFTPSFLSFPPQVSGAPIGEEAGPFR